MFLCIHYQNQLSQHKLYRWRGGHMEQQNLGESSKKEKFNFKEKKENTVHSLFEVEHFLHDFRNICKGLKLYNILRK